ncbi:transposable element Tcb1 transposase [Trichonephila clavipes]|nr:transposable element Tcb1 transposase [Trichonephila clavipes]
MSSSPVLLKTRRVGQRCTLYLSRAEMSYRWCGVVVRSGKYDACRRQIFRPNSKKEQAHHNSAGGKSVSCCLRKADLPKNCCQTFRAEGLYARRPVVYVPLTRQHRTARLQWCREHHNWTEQDWACVLFSDESRFSLSSDCRRQLIWRESGTAYRPENIQEKDRYPTCSIMVWAGIMINGRTRLHVVANGTMTGQRYIDEVLLPHVRLFRGAVGDEFVFMDDNATCHRTLAVQDCLDSEGIQRLVWPARSQDRNPIENVWDALGRQVAGRNYPPTNKNTLIRALTEEWDKLPQQLLDNVVQNDWNVDVPSWKYPRNLESPRVSSPGFGNDSKMVVINRRSTASDLSRQLSSATGTTRQTVYRRLEHIGLYARRPVRCVPLTATHCRLRLTWSTEHALWTPQQWSCVMFSDESSLQSDSRRTLLWRAPRTRYHQEKHHYDTGAGWPVWGEIILGSRTDLHVLRVTMTGHIYRDVILEQHVRLFRGAMGAEFLFMDDNARPHHEKIVDECLQLEDITRMDWPAYSPDLNPIEYVWDMLGRRIAARQPPPTCLPELRRALLDEWCYIPQDQIDNLILSMPRRCKACIASSGRHTPYYPSY